jgi:putative Holliday junction resolvase
MPVLDLAEMTAALARGRRLMGLDVGTKTIGIALSDTSLMVATSLMTMKRTKFTQDVEELFRLIDQHDVGGLIIGLPVNMDGTQGPKCQSVRHFGKNVMDRRDMAVSYWDERWSTQAVTRTLIDADVSRKRRGEVVDKLAASYILQGALEAVRARAR